MESKRSSIAVTSELRACDNGTMGEAALVVGLAEVIFGGEGWLPAVVLNSTCSSLVAGLVYSGLARPLPGAVSSTLFPVPC